MTASHHHRRRTVAAALENVKNRHFVGRREECRFFAQYLAGATGEWLILNVHGPGGIGKSTLLDAFRRIAERCGALYLALDAREFAPTPEGLVQRLAGSLGIERGGEPPSLESCLGAIRAAADRRPVIVAFDTYEELTALDPWLREAFLARLAERTVVVIAGRHPLASLWRESPVWRQFVRPLPLEPFDFEQTREFLALHGVTDDALVNAAWDFTRGHPLALTLASALAAQEGPAALARAPGRPEVVAELARRWLREVPDERLRALVEAAATVRRFAQDLLAWLTGAPVTRSDFERLLALSFVRGGDGGWSLHDMVRAAVARDLSWRVPGTLRRLRQRALAYFARLAVLPGNDQERVDALGEFIYLLGDALMRVALFDADEVGDGSALRVVPATPGDLPALQRFMAEWRVQNEDPDPVEAELVDRVTGARFRHVVTADHHRRETDFINVAELMDQSPGAIRVLKDPDGELRGWLIAMPVNARTLAYLETQPVTRAYFRTLTPEQRAEYADPSRPTTTWFLRLVALRDTADTPARAALLRDSIRLVPLGGCLLVSTPLAVYQDLLRRLGFQEVEGATHFDYGPDSPSPTFILDLRGPRLAEYLARLAGQVGPEGGANTLDEALADRLAERLGAWATDTAAVEGRARPAPEPDVAALDRALAELTPREREVALAVLEGWANAEIAERLYISEVTVKKHLSNIFAKIGVSSRTQLIKRIIQGGVVQRR